MLSSRGVSGLRLGRAASRWPHVTSEDPSRRSERRRRRDLSRRSFLHKSMRAGAVEGVGYGAWILASDELTESKAERAVRRGTSMPPTTTEAPTTTAAPPVHDIHAAWVIEENMHPGTTDWNIRDLGAPHSIEGYFDRVSAVVGDVVHLYVSTTAAQWHVEAYRLGWYQGLGGRLVWTSPPQSGVVQTSRTIDPATNLAEASWS